MTQQLSLFDEPADPPAEVPGHAPPAPDAAQVLATLADWAATGRLRRLDAAFARFIAELSPQSSAPVLLAVALTAHLEGLGHSCLPLGELLDELTTDSNRLLGWEPEPREALRQLVSAMGAALPAWLAALRGCDAVCADEGNPAPKQPLVLRGDRLYLRRYWLFEQRVARQVRQRTASLEAVDEPAVRRWLDRLFPIAPPDGRLDWQKIACAVALRGRLSIITGGPGTGKTYTAARLLALLFATAREPDTLRIALAAPTGKAAARLKQSIEGALQGLQANLGDTLPLQRLASHIGAARTLHSLLGARPDTRRFARHAGNPLDVDVLLVDEASMVHLEMMAALLDAVPADARVILLGDKDQLASVEAGAVLGDLCRDAQRGAYTDACAGYVEAVTGHRIPEALRDAGGSALAQHTVMLRHSQRFGGAIGELASVINAGDGAAALRLVGAAASPALHWLPTATPAAVLALATGVSAEAAGSDRGYCDYLDTIRSRPVDPTPEVQEDWTRQVLSAFDRFRVLCAVRDGEWGVDGLNRAIARRLSDEGWITARGEWYEGRPVMVTRNDPGLGVFNGDVGIALKVAPGDSALRAYFVEGRNVRSVSVARLADVETAFAMTVHKSQGSEFDHTVLVLPPHASGVTRELIYTGITRARSALTLVTGRRESLAEGIAESTRRASGLGVALVGDGR